MTITPLQAKFFQTDVPSREPKRNGEAAAFTKLLDQLQAADSMPPVTAEHAAAELLRLELMLSSLSLGGDPDASNICRTPALGNLLSCLARNGSAISGDNALASVPDAAPSSADPSPHTPQDLSEVGQTAARYLGTPYRFGGEDASGIDCSSFVQQVYRDYQIDLPRTAREQMKIGSDVATADLKKGDLVFFRTYASYPSHVGIYLGEGKMIHASSGKGEVTVSDFNSQYYRSRFLGAKRVA